MFVPVFGDPWSGSTCVRLPRSAPFHASAFEDPFPACVPHHDQYAAPVEPLCNCRSCAMARPAAAVQAHDFGIRPHLPGHAHHPMYARHPLYHQQQHPAHYRHGQQQSPYAHAFARQQAMPPCIEDVDDELYEADQLQQEVTHDEPSCPAYPSFCTTSSRPASVHAAIRPAKFAGIGLGTEPERVTTQHIRPVPPCSARSGVATRLQQQQQVQAASVPATPTRGRQIKVQVAHNSTPAAQHVTVHCSSSQPTGQQQRKPAQAAQPARQLSVGEAATIIQSWWRMSRLTRQQPAVKALAAAATQLNNASAKFDKYKADSSAGADSNGHLSHKQYAELNELAMHVLLQLDATSCGVSELRTIRKRLTATAIKLLDDIQGAYSAGVHSSMELSDADVKAAVQGLQNPKAAEVAPAAAAESAVSTTAEQHQAMQQDSAQKGQQQQQQLAAMQTDGPVESTEAGGAAAGPVSDRQGAVEGAATSEDDDVDNRPAAAVPERTAAAAAAAAESSLNVVSMPASEEAQTVGYIAEQQCAHGNACDEVLRQDLQTTQEQQQIGAEIAAGVDQPVVEDDRTITAMSNITAGVHIVLVYPGSRVDAAMQTE